MTAILKAEALHYRFDGQITALNGLDLCIDRGRCLAVLGPNGAGKSTLFLHLNGSIRPGAGQVRLHGAAGDYSRRGLLAWRSKVALVLQDADDQLFAATVAEDVSFGPLNQGLSQAEARIRVEQALTALGLSDLADRPTHMLSGGQKKRAAIAGAVAMQPEVLLLDEPTAGLDHDGTEQLVALLKGLRAGGMTLVFSSHDIELAARLADDVVLFNAGKAVAQGRAEAILSDRAALAQVGMRPPMLVDLWLTACDLGLCDRADPMPADLAAFQALMARWQVRRPVAV